MALWKGQEFGDFELRCRARITEGVKDGAVWIRFRYRSNHEHYALAMRGWPCNDLFLFRFGPGGGDRLLGREPLGFEPVVGQWYGLRIECVGVDVRVYVNNEREPRLSATDESPLAGGLVGVGGGYRKAEYADLSVEPEAALSTLPKALAESRRPPRGTSRAQHRPVMLPRVVTGRQVVSLDGTWLFLPDQEREPGKDPRDRKVGDGNWHGLDVPQFWPPMWWWIYGPGEGTSDLWVEREEARLAALSFDPEQTHAGWYRQWITIPKTYEKRRLVLQFDGVAMTCEVWLNGTHVGGHVGMFGPFELEVPADAIRWNERNLLVVYVADGAYRGQGDPKEVLGTEVSVDVTREMLNSLPRGMYSRSAGIWRPVRLVATERTYIADVFARTRTDGLDLDVTVAGEQTEGLRCTATVTDRLDRTALTQVSGAVDGGKATLSQGGLAPKLWTPDTPNLYGLHVELLSADGRVLDTYDCALGFRTFGVRGNRLYLNGRPYWLRGANHAPSGLAPNSREVARDFLRRMHEGNTVVLRAHASSFTEVWLDAADELGIGVSMEGIWPWVMIDDTPPPSEELLKVWEDEWTGVVRRMRNHPSILMWTLNNESYWYRARDPELRKRKWEIATRMIRAMRAIDPTRPVVCDSGYVRKPETYEQELKPNDFDDGDVDDAHWYHGWYSPGPWSLYPQAPDAEPPLERLFSGTRPAISQEFSTGYPNNDTGHPTRKYITDHHVAQAWVGDYAYEDRDPSVYLQRQAWMAKELTELARRHRSKLCGLLHFCNCNWFRFPYDPQAIEPYPAYEAMKTAMAPVLVSADLRKRRFFAGDALAFEAYIVNDSVDGSDLPPTALQAELVDAAGAPLARTAVQAAPVPYYENRSVRLSLEVPAVLPTESRAEYRLVLRLTAVGVEVARNECPLLGATREWAGVASATAATAQPLTAGEGGTLIANGLAGVQALRARPELQAFVEGGGRILVMNAGEAVRDLLPDVVGETVTWQPEIVNFEDEASPLLDGLQPWDVCWLYTGTGAPIAATGGFRLADQPEVTVLATAIRPHSYLQKPTDVRQHQAVVLFEARVGKGKVIVSEINAAAATDPVAARLVANLLKYLSG